jgi:hypothetical protein
LGLTLPRRQPDLNYLLCATVSVVEAVREDRCQALMPAPRHDSLCNWHPWWVAFSCELSAGVPASAWPTSLA